MSKSFRPKQLDSCYGQGFLSRADDPSCLNTLYQEDAIQPVIITLSDIHPILQPSFPLRAPFFSFFGRGIDQGRLIPSLRQPALFCRHRKNKRRALMRVQEAHLPDSVGPNSPGHMQHHCALALAQPSISLSLKTFVLASGGALQWTSYSSS